MENLETTKPGWNIPRKIRDSFAEFSKLMGTVAQEDCAGALLLWQALPASVRENSRLSAKGVAKFDKNLKKRFELLALENLEVIIDKKIKKSLSKAKPITPSYPGYPPPEDEDVVVARNKAWTERKIAKTTDAFIKVCARQIGQINADIKTRMSKETVREVLLRLKSYQEKLKEVQKSLEK